MQTKSGSLIIAERRSFIPDWRIQQIHAAKSGGNLNFARRRHRELSLGDCWLADKGKRYFITLLHKRQLQAATVKITQVHRERLPR
jgi:hypothetical protein